MSISALRIENLGKQYQRGSRSEGYTTFRETVSQALLSPWKRFRTLAGINQQSEVFWALKEVSFEVQTGETIGIIGKNGAGKSTLLKILSRITEPTTGRIEMRGRVASLLEVGTGFHPELSGRENIFLNGAILGMSRAEIRSKFDQIVDFAETETFLDTPVKRYSSGMYMRLAFAIAAHLEPEVLLVDEVLAVGDASFQKKCLNKMREVGREGRTVLFVSHNMSAITRLCPRTIALHDGRLVDDGVSYRVIEKYLHSDLGICSAREWPDARQAPGNEIARLCALHVRTTDGEVTDNFDIRRPIGIEMTFDVLQEGCVLVPNFHLYNHEGTCIFLTSQVAGEWHRRPRPQGRYMATAWIPGNYLAEGRVSVEAAMSTMDPFRVHFHERDAVAFHVQDNLDGDSARGDYTGDMPGVVRPLLKWTTEFTPASKCE